MPPLKIVFDTSSLRALSEQTPQRLDALERAMKGGRVEFYATDPVIAETLKIPNEIRLRNHTNLLGLLAAQKYFLPWEGAVYHELCGKPRTLRDGKDEWTLTNCLKGVTQGKEKENVARITQHMDTDKDRLYAYYLSLQKRTQVMFGDDRRSPGDFPYDLDYVDDGLWKRRARNFVTRARLLGNDDLLSVLLGKMSNNPWSRPLTKLLGTVLHGELAQRVVRNPASYPYTRNYARVFSMLLYRNLALNETVARNDPYDAQIAYWGIACDALLSRDRVQKARFRDLYHNTKPAYTVDELLHHLCIP